MIKLTKKAVTGNPYYKLTLVADGNDADYITTTQYIPESEFEEYQYYIYLLTKLVGKRHGIETAVEDVYRDFVFNYLSIPFYEDGYCHTLTELDLEYFTEDKTYCVIFEKAPQLPNELMRELLSRIQGGNESLTHYCYSLGIKEDELTMKDLEKIDEEYTQCPNCCWWVESFEMRDEDCCENCYEEEQY